MRVERLESLISNHRTEIVERLEKVEKSPYILPYLFLSKLYSPIWISKVRKVTLHLSFSLEEKLEETKKTNPFKLWLFRKLRKVTLYPSQGLKWKKS